MKANKCIVEGCEWLGYTDTKMCYSHTKGLTPPEYPDGRVMEDTEAMNFHPEDTLEERSMASYDAMVKKERNDNL
jgi:hypothetical protein